MSVVGGVGISLLGMYALGAGAHPLGIWFNYSVSVLGALVALVSVLQVVCQWRERGAEHRRAGAQYSHAMRELELIVSRKPLDRDALSGWSDGYTAIGATAPLVPQGMWQKAKLGHGVS